MLCGHGVAIIVLSGDGPFDVDLVDTLLFDNDMVSTLCLVMVHSTDPYLVGLRLAYLWLSKL